MTVGRAQRASAAMDYLKSLFGDPSPPMVIMLQEVRKESLSAIQEHPWIRENFMLSDLDPPGRYFTVMLVSLHVNTSNWFRVPLPSKMGRDALFVDIPLKDAEAVCHVKILRLCTTHLESLWETEGNEKRPLQLAQISSFLKAAPIGNSRIVAGLLGGDMNSISALDAVSHQAAAVDLRDVWGEPPLASDVPPTKRGVTDLTYGRVQGHTWGYFNPKAHSRKRFDKFLITGAADTVPVAEAQDMTRDIGRLGIGLMTKAEVWECQFHLNAMVKVKGGGLC